MHVKAIDDRGARVQESTEVEKWIRERLTAAGFSDDDATVVIGAGLDWRALVRLRERGCPRQLAFEIVR